MNLNYNKGLVLVSGHVKSGKSRLAESILINKQKVTYLATSRINYDCPDWNERISIHNKRRPINWKLVESPDLKSTLQLLEPCDSLLVDSLGGIVAFNLSLDNSKWNVFKENTIDSIKTFQGLIVIVIEETGWGVSPSTKLGNIFRDRLGELTQNLEEISIDSWLVIHGRAINIKNISNKI